MPIEIKCPSCSRALKVPDNLIGQRVKCPSCTTTFTAEQPSDAASPPPPPPQEKPRPQEDSYRDHDRPEDEPPPRRRLRDDDYDRPNYQIPHRGTLVLVLGILSIALSWPFGLFLGLPAWIMGTADLRRMREGTMDPSGDGQTRAGWICGIIGTCLGSLSLLVCCGWLAIAIGFGVSSSNAHHR